MQIAALFKGQLGCFGEFCIFKRARAGMMRLKPAFSAFFARFRPPSKRRKEARGFFCRKGVFREENAGRRIPGALLEQPSALRTACALSAQNFVLV